MTELSISFIACRFGGINVLTELTERCDSSSRDELAFEYTTFVRVLDVSEGSIEIVGEFGLEPCCLVVIEP